MNIKGGNIRKFILIIIFLFVFISQGWCATKYARNVTANWNVDSTWSTTSGGDADTTVPTSADDVIFDANSGTITLTASTTINSLVCTGYTGTLTHNASVTLTIDGQDGSGNSLLLVSGMTYTIVSAASSAIAFTGAGTSKITTGTKTLGSIEFNNSGDTFQLQDGLTTSGSIANTAGTFDPNFQTVTMTGATPTITPTAALSFYNLTRTGNAVKTNTLLLLGSITVTNTFNINGNSSVNRMLFASNILGTARTVTITGATISGCSNVDFRDITFANGGSNVDLSGITGGSGDCGGNTISGGGVLSFTTASTQDCTMSSNQNWSTVGIWTSRVPLPQDDVTFTGVSGTCTLTVDMPRLGATIDTSGAGGTFTLALNSTANTIYGGLDLSGVDTLTSNQVLNFEGRGNYTLNSNAKTFGSNVYISMVGGTLTFLSNIIISNTVSLWLLNGTLDADIYNVNVGRLASSGSGTRTLLMGSGTWTLAYASGSGYALDFSTSTTGWTSLNVGETSTIILSSSTNNAFRAPNGFIFNNLTINTGSGACTFVYSNTFNTFTINAPKTVNFTAATTTTVSSFVATGDAVNGITITSATAAAHILTDTSGTNSVSYCTISYSQAGGGADWQAYTTNGNTDGENNTGWVFTAPGGAPAISQVIWIN